MGNIKKNIRGGPRNLKVKTQTELELVMINFQMQK